MAYQILPDEPVPQAIKRIAHEQLEKAIAELSDRQLDVHETVHQVRKRCKKVRGLLRLVRPAFEKTYDRENAWYRDTARSLSSVRDAEAFIETYDALMDHYEDETERPAFASIRRQFTNQKKALAKQEIDLDQRLEECSLRFKQGQKRIETWQLDSDEFNAMESGVKKTYRRGRDAMRRAYKKPCTVNFHEWRKRTKYHRYHVHLLCNIWEEPMKALRDEAVELSDLLGEDHDLSLFRIAITENATDFGSAETIQAILGLLTQRQVELRLEARLLGVRMFAEKPKRFVKRLSQYWHAMRCGSRQLPQEEHAPHLVTI